MTTRIKQELLEALDFVSAVVDLLGIDKTKIVIGGIHGVFGVIDKIEQIPVPNVFFSNLTTNVKIYIEQSYFSASQILSQIRSLTPPHGCAIEVTFVPVSDQEFKNYRIVMFRGLPVPDDNAANEKLHHTDVFERCKQVHQFGHVLSYDHSSLAKLIKDFTEKEKLIRQYKVFFKERIADSDPETVAWVKSQFPEEYKRIIEAES